MAAKSRWFPFTAEQTVNILSEFGPLVTMFIVNAIGGIHAGTWALIISTVIAMIVMRLVVGRLPIFPIIASTVTIVFGFMTLITHDPVWIKIKVSIFNAMFAGFLFGGLWATSTIRGRTSLWSVVGLTAVVLLAQTPYLAHLTVLPAVGDERNPLTTNLICLGALVVGFLMGGLVFQRNFFGYVFEKTFHFTHEGWDRFTYSFAWFFVLTAVLNELIRQVYVDSRMYDILGMHMNGTNVWILFKIAFIMPLSGLYAWFLTRLMQKYRIDEPQHAAAPVRATRREVG
jgi:intracellular septation protein